MQVKTKIPRVPKVSLITAALCVSEIPSTDKGTKTNRPRPSDFKSTDTLLPSSLQTNNKDMEKKKVVTASIVSEPLERENLEIHSESQQNEEAIFVTEVI